MNVKAKKGLERLKDLVGDNEMAAIISAFEEEVYVRVCKQEGEHIKGAINMPDSTCDVIVPIGQFVAHCIEHPNRKSTSLETPNLETPIG